MPNIDPWKVEMTWRQLEKQKGSFLFKPKELITQSFLTLCDPMDCSLPLSSFHGILQARILEWVALPFSRGSSWPRERTQVCCIAGRFFTLWATGETFTFITRGLPSRDVKSWWMGLRETQGEYPLSCLW